MGAGVDHHHHHLYHCIGLFDRRVSGEKGEGGGGGREGGNGVWERRRNEECEREVKRKDRYSQTCLLRPSKGNTKSGHCRQGSLKIVRQLRVTKVLRIFTECCVLRYRNGKHIIHYILWICRRTVDPNLRSFLLKGYFGTIVPSSYLK